MKIKKYQNPFDKLKKAKNYLEKTNMQLLRQAISNNSLGTISNVDSKSDSTQGNQSVRISNRNRQMSEENTLQKRFQRRPGMLSYNQQKEEKELKNKKNSAWYSRNTPLLSVSPSGQYSAYGPEQFYEDQTGNKMPTELRPTPVDNFNYVIQPTIAGLGVPALAYNPFLAIPTLAGSAVGEVAVNKGTKLLTGNTFDENISNWTGMPITVSKYFNPGLWWGGKQGYNVLRRGIETAMRTGSGAEPISIIRPNIKTMWKNGDRGRLFDIAKYITTGIKSGPKGSYNSFRYNHYTDDTINQFNDYYRGFLDDNPEILKVEGNDVIDAFLYGKTIDPEYGLYLEPGKNYGLFQKYIDRFYPNKNIQIYNTEKYPMDYKNLTNYHKTSSEFSIPTSKEYLYDSAGHIIESGYTPDGKLVSRDQDIWKFEPKAYYNKWIKSLSGKQPSTVQKFLIKNGLKAADAVGTPIIVKSPWRSSEGNMLYHPNGLTNFSLGLAPTRYGNYSYPKTF